MPLLSLGRKKLVLPISLPGIMGENVRGTGSKPTEEEKLI